MSLLINTLLLWGKGQSCRHCGRFLSWASVIHSLESNNGRIAAAPLPNTPAGDNLKSHGEIAFYCHCGCINRISSAAIFRHVNLDRYVRSNLIHAQWAAWKSGKLNLGNLL